MTQLGELITSEYQLRRWVAGQSIHRLVPDVEGGECCPDFSCCRPDLLQPPEVRRAFAAADERGRSRWLGHFLGALLEGERVHIAGLPEDS
jgi:hypothetical protein